MEFPNRAVFSVFLGLYMYFFMACYKELNIGLDQHKAWQLAPIVKVGI